MVTALTHACYGNLHISTYYIFSTIFQYKKRGNVGWEGAHLAFLHKLQAHFLLKAQFNSAAQYPLEGRHRKLFSSQLRLLLLHSVPKMIISSFLFTVCLWLFWYRSKGNISFLQGYKFTSFHWCLAKQELLNVFWDAEAGSWLKYEKKTIILSVSQQRFSPFYFIRALAIISCKKFPFLYFLRSLLSL